MRRVYELGYHSLEELESAFNDRISDQYLMMRRLVQNAIGSDTVQELDYIYNDVYFTIKARCLAKLPDKALLALQLRIFETENKTKTSDDMMRYGNALFATYELVTIISPKKDSSERIFSRMGIQSYAKTTGLKDSFRAFCQNEIVREDQDRYMAFCDLDSLEKRVSKEGFIQSFFRLKSTREWKSVRISRIPSDVEVSYLYTIQSVLKEENRRMHIYAKDHSEL